MRRLFCSVVTFAGFMLAVSPRVEGASHFDLDGVTVHSVPIPMADDPGVTGQTITDAQILQVQAFEQARADADQATIDADQAIIDDVNSTPEQIAAAQLDQQAALNDRSQALSLVEICNKALAGNPKDRSKVAFLYDQLVIAGSIPGA